MAVSPETSWALVASGLIAHADGVLDGHECELLLSLIEDEADGDEYSEWLSNIGDEGTLRAIMKDLPALDAGKTKGVLEQAWAMALVDGDRCAQEIRVLEELADRLGVEHLQLEFWREAWQEMERSFSTCAAHAMAVVLGGDGPVFPADRGRVRDAVQRLPTTADHREELLSAAAVPTLRTDVAAILGALPRPRRLQLLHLLAPLVLESAAGDAARTRFIELATSAGIDVVRADAILEAAG